MALLSAMLAFTATAVAGADTASAATSIKSALCSVNMRTGPRTSSRIKTTIKTGTKVTVVARVVGGSWKARCGGKTVSSRYWYRISAINGRSVKSRFGVRYVYAAAGLFRAAPTVAPTTTPTQAPTPVPTIPAGWTSVNVASIPALLSALADNSVDEIVVADGTYSISGSGNQASNSLWIGSRYASRTRPVTVRAQTVGGVTFDGGGGYLGGISFNGGAHDQTWDGFHFANGTTSQTGVIMFGGYAGMAAPYNITLKDITVDASCHRVNSGATDHAVYFSYAVGGPHDILLEDLTVDASDPMGLVSAVHMDHGYASDAPNTAAHDVTVRGLTFTGNTGIASQQAIILWQPPTSDWLFDGATITNSGGLAIRYESSPGSNIVFQNITSVNSGGFYSSQGTQPAGVTFSNDVLH